MQAQVVFPVDISTRELSPLQLDKSCYSNYSNYYPSQTNCMNMEGKKGAFSAKDTLIDPHCETNSNGNEPLQRPAGNFNNNADVNSDAEHEAKLLGGGSAHRHYGRYTG